MKGIQRVRYVPAIVAVMLHWNVSQGQVFYEGAGWEQIGPLPYTAFGWSMSNAGDVNGDDFDDMIVTAIDYSNPVETNGEEGKVYLYYGSASGLSLTPAWQFESDNDSSVLGFSSDGGDLNGDGYSDIVIGCLQMTDPEYNEGEIFLWYGSPAGLNPAGPDWTIEMDQTWALLGGGVALDGDINSDGYNDLVFAAKQWDGPEIDEGKIWMYWGSPTGPVASGWTWESNQEYAIAGFPVNYAGDVNNDGFDDIVIGANQYDSIDIDDGLVVAFYGSASGLAATPDWSMSSGQKKCNFGHWVDGAGDVNGDGYDDVVVSALLYEDDTTYHSEGRIFVYYGSATGLQHEVAWFGDVNQPEAQLGYSCAGAGDINGDGYDDVIGGAKYWTNGEDQEGGAFVWFGGPDGLDTDYCWQGEGNNPLGYYGRHVGGKADFNHDGYSDFMVGAYRFTEVQEADGKGFVYYGAPRPVDFHYAQDSFCLEVVNPIPVIDGTPGGYFSSDEAVVDSITGEINLLASGSGTFYIYYHGEGFCNTGKFKIFIQDALQAENIFQYAENNYCAADADPLPEMLMTSSGYFYSDDAVVDSLTGTLDLDASGYGDHIIYFSGTTYLGCNIIAIDSVHIDYDASFYFAQDTFCLYDMSPYPVIDNPLTGTFTCSDCSINPVSGKLNLMSTGVGGPYTIYYNAHTTCDMDSFAVWIIDRSAADSSIYYASDTFCINGDDPLPIFISGDGNFTSTNAVVNYSSGKIDITSTGVGGPFTIYYTENNLCITDSFAFYIIPFDTTAAAFHYDAGYYCINDVDPAPIIDGLIGGTFSSDAIIDDSTGTIDLSASGSGSFYITYSTSDINGCSVEQTEYILIDDPDGTFYYDSVYYFMGDADPAAHFTGDTGIISSSPEGLIFTDTVGTIDLINSTGGTYSIVNSVSDSLCSEEYVFTILILEPCVAPDTFYISDTTIAGATISWPGDTSYSNYIVYVMSATDTTIYYAGDTTLILTGLLPETNYTIIIGIDCGGYRIEYTPEQSFTTLKPVNISGNPISILETIYPNPASDQVIISIGKYNGPADIEFYNAAGVKIKSWTSLLVNGATTLSLQNIPDGFYYILLQTTDNYYSGGVIVQKAKH